MLLFVGELLDVQTGDYNTLVFKSKRFDVGLGVEVPCSEQVGISEECKEFIPNYKKNIGEFVAVPIRALKTKKGGIFLLAQSDLLDFTMLTNEGLDLPASAFGVSEE